MVNEPKMYKKYKVYNRITKRFVYKKFIKLTKIDGEQSIYRFSEKIWRVLECFLSVTIFYSQKPDIYVFVFFLQFFEISPTLAFF